MLLDLALHKRLLFFGGKGGVGKTTVSAATALMAAARGRRVLLVSTDPAHNLGHLLETRIGPRPKTVADNLSALEVDPDETVNDHLRQVTGELRRLMPTHLRGEVDKHMEQARHAPGMQEAALLERIAQLVEDARADCDLLIFDTAPSGHTARLMALPEMMSAWTEGLMERREKAEGFKQVWRKLGSDTSMEDKLFASEPAGTATGDDRDRRIRHLLNRRRERLATLRDSIADSARTAFVIVLAAERLPVLESIELHGQLQRNGVHVGGLVVNKRLPEAADGFLAERRQQENIHLQTLEQALPRLPRQDIPLSPNDVLGVHTLQDFANQLTD